MDFPVVSAQDIPKVSHRVTKTFPLRQALMKLEIGQAIEVAYDSQDEAGFKPTTINQVASTLSALHDTIRFSIKRKPDGTGCYVIAADKFAPGSIRRGRPKQEA